MVINGAIVSDLDMMYLESVLQEELSLVMMMRLVSTFNQLCYITTSIIRQMHSGAQFRFT